MVGWLRGSVASLDVVNMMPMMTRMATHRASRFVSVP